MSAALADLQDSWVGSSKLLRQSFTEYEYRIHLENFWDKEIPENPPYPVFRIKFTIDQIKCINFFRKFIKGLLSEEELGLIALGQKLRVGQVNQKYLLRLDTTYIVITFRVCTRPFVGHYHTNLITRLFAIRLV